VGLQWTVSCNDGLGKKTTWAVKDEVCLLFARLAVSAWTRARLFQLRLNTIVNFLYNPVFFVNLCAWHLAWNVAESSSVLTIFWLSCFPFCRWVMWMMTWGGQLLSHLVSFCSGTIPSLVTSTAFNLMSVTFSGNVYAIAFTKCLNC